MTNSRGEEETTNEPDKPKMPARLASQRSGRIHVQPNLPPLPADKFYAAIPKKRGPARKPLVEVLRCPSEEVANPYRSYTVSYKLSY